MDPFDDFEAILSCDYCYARHTRNEVLQRNTTLQGLTALLQRAKRCCITVWKAKLKIYSVTDLIMHDKMLLLKNKNFKHEIQWLLPE